MYDSHTFWGKCMTVIHKKYAPPLFWCGMAGQSYFDQKKYEFTQKKYDSAQKMYDSIPMFFPDDYQTQVRLQGAGSEPLGLGPSSPVENRNSLACLPG